MSYAESLRLNAVKLRKLAEQPYRLSIAERAFVLDAALDLESAAVWTQPTPSADRVRAAFMAGHLAAQDQTDKYGETHETPEEAYAAWIAQHTPPGEE